MSGGPTSALLAAVPVLVILVLMVWRGWSAARAGIVGVVVALAVAVLGFGLAGRYALGLPAVLGGTGAEAGFTALAILWIIGPALSIHQLQLHLSAARLEGYIVKTLSSSPLETRCAPIACSPPSLAS